jgi:acetyltransferase-like isoleucine patch superfamily enzyme
MITLYLHHKLKYEIDQQRKDETVEHEQVIGSNAVINPRAMVVINHNALLAHLAMLRSRRPNYLAIWAYLLVLIIS